jgi:hypothetical protein
MSGTALDNATYYATVDHMRDPDGIECVCDNCDWKGVASDLNEITDASLTPGDASPAGRCPLCAALAYVDKPGVNDLAGLLRDLLNCAELSQDDLEPGTVVLIEAVNKTLEGL